MKSTPRSDFLSQLDKELLKGDAVISEWCAAIVREADTAFIGGANLATILTATAGAEAYLRSRYSVTGRERFAELIDAFPVNDGLRVDLHELRRYRNKWVHVDASRNDERFSTEPLAVAGELESMAEFACQVLRRTIYKNQLM